MLLTCIGITVSGLDDPLTVGQTNVTISCMTNIPVDSIEWRDQSSSVLSSISSAEDLTMLEYTIPLVTDDLNGQQFTCIAIAGDTTYTETVEIHRGIIQTCMASMFVCGMSVSACV